MQSGDGPAPDFAQRLRSFRVARRLSQLDLANACGLSQKHVSFLETGRSAPGRSTVSRLSIGLGLSHLESDDLLLSAGFAPSDKSGRSTEDSLTTIDAALDRVIALQNPFPGVIVDSQQNLLRNNSAFDNLLAWALPDWDVWSETCGRGQKNLMRMTLHERGLFPMIKDPLDLVPVYLDRVRRESSGDRRAQDLIAEIEAWPHITPHTKADRHSSSTSAVIEERFCVRNQDMGFICLIARIGAPGTSYAESLRLELFHPSDDATEDLIRAICPAS